MASVNVMKLHGSEAASILAHNHRHDGKDIQYRNEHIDKSKTASNSYRYFKGQDPAATSKDEYTRLKARVEEIDKAEPPKRIRKDRVTMCAFEIPAPAGLPAEKEEKFFSLAYREIARMCGGAENVSTLRIHRDEVHEYTDPLTKERKTSRVHAHVVGIPYVKGKGVNCKQFMTRQALRDLQRRIDDKCRQNLNIAFMDGSRQRSRGTVEDLKLASAKAEDELALAERITSQKAQIAEQEARLEELRQDTAKAALDASRARAEALEQQERAEDFRAEAGKLYERLHQLGTLDLMVDYVEKFHERDFKLWAMDWARDEQDIEIARKMVRERDDDLER